MKFADLRKDFPVFEEKAETKQVPPEQVSPEQIYFDNAATTQKPDQVIQTLANFYAFHTANIFRSVYLKAEEATSIYEEARSIIAEFIGADARETIFTSGTTDGINLIASTWGELHIGAGDEIIVSQMEHHSNFLPWQQLAKKKRAKLVIIPVTADGLLDMEAYEQALSKKTKLVAVTHISNVLGTTNDVKKITTLAHEVGARVLVDAAQSAPHRKLNVHDMGADFLVFSGHKMLGPTGVGILYIKQSLEAEVPPYQFGGGMVSNVCREESVWTKAPHKFEAGTPPIAQAVGLGAAVEYLVNNVNFDALQKHEASLCGRVIDGLQEIDGIKLLGPCEQLKREGHLVSFVVKNMHAHDVAAFLDGAEISVAVRAGQHCAQPLHAILGIPASVRVSFYLYNTLDEVELFIDKMKKLPFN